MNMRGKRLVPAAILLSAAAWACGDDPGAPMGPPEPGDDISRAQAHSDAPTMPVATTGGILEIRGPSGLGAANAPFEVNPRFGADALPDLADLRASGQLRAWRVGPDGKLEEISSMEAGECDETSVLPCDEETSPPKEEEPEPEPLQIGIASWVSARHNEFDIIDFQSVTLTNRPVPYLYVEGHSELYDTWGATIPWAYVGLWSQAFNADFVATHWAYLAFMYERMCRYEQRGWHVVQDPEIFNGSWAGNSIPFTLVDLNIC